MSKNNIYRGLNCPLLLEFGIAEHAENSLGGHKDKAVMLFEVICGQGTMDICWNKKVQILLHFSPVDH